MSFMPKIPLQGAPVVAPHRVHRHRTLFISDIHLGTRGCKAELLIDFLAHNDCQTLYLVSDIVDGWALKYRWYWPDSHSGVLNGILRKVAEGTRAIYVPGNHDEAFRDYCGHSLAGVELHYEIIHETAGGRNMLVLHGDHFDGVVRHAKWLTFFGAWAYEAALAINTGFNLIRRKLGLPYWSLSAYLKHKVKNAVEFISNFEQAVARETEARGADGVVCGHIHHAEMKRIGGVLYCNDGDWVESCTALTEDARGTLEIVRWTAFAHEREHATRPRAARPHALAPQAA